MEDWQQRVISERDELGVKLTKLVAFISGNPACQALPGADRDLLRDQRSAMFDYRVALDARISRFTDGKDSQ